MFGLPKDSTGTVQYRGLLSNGGMNPEQKRVLLKAKGALYLDQLAQKKWDRFWSLSLGLVGGVLGGVVTAWLKQLLFTSNTN